MRIEQLKRLERINKEFKETIADIFEKAGEWDLSPTPKEEEWNKCESYCNGLVNDSRCKVHTPLKPQIELPKEILNFETTPAPNSINLHLIVDRYNKLVRYLREREQI